MNPFVVSALARLAQGCRKTMADASLVLMGLDLEEHEERYFQDVIEYNRDALADLNAKVSDEQLLTAEDAVVSGIGDFDRDVIVAELKSRANGE